MICSNCGRENQGDNKNCTNCNAPLGETPEKMSNVSVNVRASKLAIVAIIFAVLGPAIIFLCSVLKIAFIAFAGLCISAIALILGIISFVRIEAGGGKITGRNFALLSIIIPIFAGLFLPIYSIFFAHRSVAYRMVCGTNLSGIGKAMLIYANDYEDEFPRAGGRDSVLGKIADWKAATRQKAFGMNANGTGGSATLSSSLYLLVKYMQVTPKHFVCNKDLKVSEFYPESVLDRIKKKIGKGKIQRNIDIPKYWDFGPEPWKHNSYSYHMPYGDYALNTSRSPDMAIMADRNPWLSSRGWEVKAFSSFDPDGERIVTYVGNSPCHQDEGQNVLFNDSHVDFKNKSFCGANDDNIYTSWNGSDIRKGIKPEFGSQPVDKMDSLLINDIPPKGR